MRERLCLDYETRSELDLKKVGAITYAQHPSTEIICVGYKLNKKRSRIWLPWKDPIPADLESCMEDSDLVYLAHNALFEQAITGWVLNRYLKKKWAPSPERWRCSAAKAAACALPRDLEGAALALNLPINKDMRGNRLMKKHMKPRSAWMKSGKGEKYFEDEWEREEIYRYCSTDVDVECLLDESLPDLIPFEREIWILNQEMNLRGVRIDIPTVKRIQGWIESETKNLNAELARITGGVVTTAAQRDVFLKWIRIQGEHVPNLQAGTVTKALTMIKHPKVRRALEIRQSLGKSSVKKYPAMLIRTSRDERVKDYALYHGASTGRDTGRGLQLQNLVKGKIKNTDLAIDLINSSSLEEIRMLYGDPFEVFSSCVRGMVTATPGSELFVADYNAIEARVLQWLAGDEAGLNRWRKNIDSYKLMASKIYGKPENEISPAEREVGKRAELGSGYQMGGPKFYETCLQFGALDVTLELCKRAVAVFRKVHPEIVRMWADLERAAVRATLKPGCVIRTNKTAWSFDKRFLWCELPSKRKLAFYGPTVRSEPAPWGEPMPKLYHWQVHPKTKQWVNLPTYGGKLTENVTQAVARDVLMNAIRTLGNNGYRYLFSVHDEAVAEAAKGSIEEYEKLLTNLPAWAEGLPIKAKGWRGFRYKKV